MIRPVFQSVLEFRIWLDKNGYSYLEDGVLSWYPGDALWEIARRAGVRGLKGSDVVADTLPLIAEIILLRCKPIKYPEKTGVV